MDISSSVVEDLVLEELEKQFHEQKYTNVNDFRLKHDRHPFNPYRHIIRITYLPIDFNREFYVDCLHLEKSYLEMLKRSISHQISIFFVQIKPFSLAFS